MKYRSRLIEGGAGSGIKGHKPGDPVPRTPEGHTTAADAHRRAASAAHQSGNTAAAARHRAAADAHEDAAFAHEGDLDDKHDSSARAEKLSHIAKTGKAPAPKPRMSGADLDHERKAGEDRRSAAANKSYYDDMGY